MIVLDIKYAMCMSKNDKDTKHTRRISRRIHLVRNVETFNMYKIDGCEGELQLADIGTKNSGEPNLKPRMKYIMIILEN